MSNELSCPLDVVVLPSADSCSFAATTEPFAPYNSTQQCNLLFLRWSDREHVYCGRIITNFSQAGSPPSPFTWPAFSVSDLSYKKVKDRQYVSLYHLLGLSSVCSAKNSLQIIPAFIHHLSFSIYEGRVKGNVGLGHLSLVCLSVQIWPQCTHEDKIVHIRWAFLSSRCSFRDFYRERKFPSLFKWILEINGFFSYVWLTEEKWTVPIHPSCIIEMVCNLQQTPENTLSNILPVKSYPYSLEGF